MIIQCHCQKLLPIIFILKHICQIFCFQTDEGWNLLKQSMSPASHQGCRYFQGSSISPSASLSLVSAVDPLALSCLNETAPSLCPQSRSQDKYLHLSHFSASVLRQKFKVEFRLWSICIQAQVSKILLIQPSMLEGINTKKKGGKTAKPAYADESDSLYSIL